MQYDSYLVHLFKQTLSACSPGQAVADWVTVQDSMLTVGDISAAVPDQPIYVFAVGKASVPMFEKVNELLDGQIAESLVVTSNPGEKGRCSADEVVIGSHPVPDGRSLDAGLKMVRFLEAIPDRSLVLGLISGGTSSLMCYPAGNITIRELGKTFDLLNRSGAAIGQINTVRKHCSRIKGGQLLRYLPRQATLIDLLISDVPGDDPGIIGSGPTTPDESAFQQAREILHDFNLWKKVPAAIRDHIEAGLEESESDTTASGGAAFRHHQHVISSAQQFVDRAAGIAREDGHDTEVTDKPFNEDVEAVATQISEKVLSHTGNPKIFFFYGESTVQVTGEGKGGRNQELALRGALKIAGKGEISWLSAGTDGVDGPTDAAGAVVDSSTIAEARQRGLDPEEYLQQNDAYHFHEHMESLIKTGPTGNNLMDVVFVAVDS